MTYPIKTLAQLPLLLKGFRKVKGLTQAAMAERLGITQQGYAHLEANPASATLERLFIVLRLLEVEIGLTPTSLATNKNATPSSDVAAPNITANINKPLKTLTVSKAKRPATAKAPRIVVATRKKESW